MLRLDRRLCIAGALATASFLAGAAHANEITFDFGGTVTSASATVNNTPGAFAQLPPGVATGVPVLATLSYDTSTPGSTSTPNVLTYAGSGFTIDIAGNLWFGQSPAIFVGAPPMLNVHFVTIADGAFSAQPTPPTVPFSTVNATFATIALSSSASNFLNDEQLPTAPLDLSLASSASGNITADSCQLPGCFNSNGPGAANYMINFTIDSMSLAGTAVPEPSTVALLGAALLVFGGCGRFAGRRKSSATERKVRARSYARHQGST